MIFLMSCVLKPFLSIAQCVCVCMATCSLLAITSFSLPLADKHYDLSALFVLLFLCNELVSLHFLE